LRQAKGTLQQTAASERAAISRSTQQETAAIEAQSGAKTKEVAEILTGAQVKIHAQFAESRGRLAKLVESHAAQATESGERAASELHDSVAEEQKNASAASEAQATQMEQTGASEARRIVESDHETTKVLQAASARAAAQVTSEDPDVIDAVKEALAHSVQQILDKLHERSSDLASSSIEQAGDVASHIREGGQELAAQLAGPSTGAAEQAIRQNTQQLVARIQAMGPQLAKPLSDLEAQSTSALGNAQSQAAAGLAASAKAASAALHDAEGEVLTHVDNAETSASAQMHGSTVHAINELNGHPEAASTTPEDAQGFADQAGDALQTASKNTSAVLSKLSKNYSERLTEVRSRFGNSVTKAGTSARAAADKSVSEIANSLAKAEESAADAAESGLKEADAANKEGIAKFRQDLRAPLVEAQKSWADEREKVTTAIAADIDKGISQNNEVRTQAPALLADTARQAQEHAESSLASRILSGIWSGIKSVFEGLMYAVIALLVVFVAIVVLAAVFAEGIAAGVALAIAFVIVGVVMLAVGFFKAVIHRSDQFWARFGTDIPWYAQVGGFLWVLTTSVGDTFGVSQILEGILGHDLVSGEDLNAEEKSKRITEGVLTLALIWILGRVAKKPGTIPRGGGETPRLPSAPERPPVPQTPERPPVPQTPERPPEPQIPERPPATEPPRVVPDSANIPAILDPSMAQYARPAEVLTAQRLAAQYPEFNGRTFKAPPPPDPGYDWTDDAGRTYDAMGDGTRSSFFKISEFIRSINKHLNKGNTYTVIDVTGYSADQVTAITQYVDSLPQSKQAEIRRIGF
jgi:hypothetical protein